MPIGRLGIIEGKYFEQFAAWEALTFLGALFLHSIVERLLHGLRRDYWRSLWTRSREGKGAGWQLLRSL